ncbi:MAG: serine/threonine protein kinase [Gemmatales bacterium]|nr:MAG: serine/threonine protein kinase [Gemmatales bacterium]
MPRLLLFASLMGLLVPATATAQHWNRFRGPNGTGVLATDAIPVEWTEKDFLWKTKLPGTGHSSPVVWGERVFVTAGEESTGTRFVVCVRATDGTMLWTRRFDGKPYSKHRRNSVATSTPAADARHVYVAWGVPEQCVLMALDHNGKTVWEKDLGPFKGNHGFGASPVVVGDRVILANDQDGKGYVIALKATDGSVCWKLPRQSGNATYSTPCLFEGNGRQELILTNWQHGITSVDPETGKVYWEICCFEPAKKERAIASPVVAGDLVLGTCGFVTKQKHFVAVRPAKNDAKEVWRMERAVSYLPSPLVIDSRVYLCSELGVASCLDAATGKIIWQERLGDDFYASPVSTGKAIYCVSNDGDVYVLAPGDTFKVLAKNSIGEGTQSTPALTPQAILFRTPGRLIAIGKRK